MKKQPTVPLTHTRIEQILEKTLAAMIDEWYDNVCGYYSTEATAPPDAEPELKRFHDEKGHRIKFSKESLQCTYGLRVLNSDTDNRIEISVNNKSEYFDYSEFLTRLDQHYRAEGSKPGKSGSGTARNAEVFLLESDFRQAFSVERSEGKADVVRLQFLVHPEKLGGVHSVEGELKMRIEEYCLSPLRKIYAELYRRTTRR